MLLESAVILVLKTTIAFSAILVVACLVAAILLLIDPEGKWF